MYLRHLPILAAFLGPALADDWSPNYLGLNCVGEATLNFADCTTAFESSIPATHRYTTTQGGLHSAHGDCETKLEGDSSGHDIIKTVLSGRGGDAIKACADQDGTLTKPGTATIINKAGNGKFKLTWAQIGTNFNLTI